FRQTLEQADTQRLLQPFHPPGDGRRTEAEPVGGPTKAFRLCAPKEEKQVVPRRVACVQQLYVLHICSTPLRNIEHTIASICILMGHLPSEATEVQTYLPLSQGRSPTDTGRTCTR